MHLITEGARLPSGSACPGTTGCYLFLPRPPLVRGCHGQSNNPRQESRQGIERQDTRGETTDAGSQVLLSSEFHFFKEVCDDRCSS